MVFVHFRARLGVERLRNLVGVFWIDTLWAGKVVDVIVVFWPKGQARGSLIVNFYLPRRRPMVCRSRRL